MRLYVDNIDVLLGSVRVSTCWRGLDLGRSTFYKLMKQGQGPDTYLVGRRRYVSLEAMRQWQVKQKGIADSRRTHCLTGDADGPDS